MTEFHDINKFVSDHILHPNLLEAFYAETEITYVDDEAFNQIPLNELYLKRKLERARQEEQRALAEAESVEVVELVAEVCGRRTGEFWSPSSAMMVRPADERDDE